MTPQEIQAALRKIGCFGDERVAGDPPVECVRPHHARGGTGHRQAQNQSVSGLLPGPQAAQHQQGNRPKSGQLITFIRGLTCRQCLRDPAR